MLYKADTPRQRSRTQNICFLISISAVILKLMVKITSIFGPYRFLRIAWHDIFSLSDPFRSLSSMLEFVYPPWFSGVRREIAHFLVKLNACTRAGRSQTSEQDEASFERQRREPLGGSWGHAPPPTTTTTRKFWNLEAQKCSCKHFPWHHVFFREVNLGQGWKFTFLLLSDTGAKLMTICILKHLKKPLLTVDMKRINLIKMLFPSIDPPYISWFYLNQSNFF